MGSTPGLRVGVVVIALAMAGGPLLATDEENKTMEERCRQEVIELHRFFQDWFNAELTQDAASFARLDKALASDFEIIGPEGLRVERSSVVPVLRSGYGQHSAKKFTIEVREIRSRRVGDDMVLATYEEHQTADGEPRSWLSSALFRGSDGNPNGVEWVHVQETYLPRDER